MDRRAGGRHLFLSDFKSHGHAPASAAFPYGTGCILGGVLPDWCVSVLYIWSFREKDKKEGDGGQHSGTALHGRGERKSACAE